VRGDGAPPTECLGAFALAAAIRVGVASAELARGRFTAAKVFAKRTLTGDGGRVLAPELGGPLVMLTSEARDFLGLFLGARSGLRRERFRELENAAREC